MSRTKDNSLDYFPLDVDFFSDSRIRRLHGRFGSDGPMFLIYIFCRCYGGEGYYIEANDDFYEDAALDIGCTVEKIGLMLNYLLDKSLLDSTLFNTVKVLTSHGIQAQYQKSKKGCKRDIEVDETLWVLDEAKTEEFVKVCPQKNNSEKKGHFSGKKDDISENYPQSKVNEIKRKESTLSVSDETDCRDDFRRVMEAWNALGLAKVSRITSGSDRYKQLNRRLKDYGVDEVLRAIVNVSNSDFLMGRAGGNRPFEATFDWFIKPNNFQKVLDGNYANRRRGGEPQSSNPFLDLLEDEYGQK